MDGQDTQQVATRAEVATFHERVARLARAVGSLPAVQCPVNHHFSPGVYGREMFVRAGTVVVGKIHKFENMLIMSLGRAAIIDGDGPPREVEAPFMCVSPPGIQRAVFAHTDCVFISVHGTDKTDVAEIEREFIAQDHIEYQEFLKLSHQGTGE